LPPVAKHDDSRPKRNHTNLSVLGLSS
jgi:hypothetical protein